MNEKLKHILKFMLRHNMIGAKHLPEKALFNSALKHLNKNIQKEIYKEYENLIRQEYFIRLKKRTGKGSEYHISLNPEMIEEINDLVEGE
jgi:hypothetical protein